MKNWNQWTLKKLTPSSHKDNGPLTQHGPLEDNEEERIEEGEEVEEVDMQHIAQEDEQVSSNHETVSDTFAEGSSNISDWKTDPGNVSPSACTSKCYSRLFFCPFQKNSRPKKLKKSPPPKKLKGHFEQKTQCVGVNLRFQLKNFEILTIWSQF